MARLAPRLVRQPARKQPPAGEDLGSGIHPQRYRRRVRLSSARRARARRAARPRDRRLRIVDARRVRIPAVPAAALLLLSLLGACNEGAPEPEAESTEVPEELAAAPPPVVAA